MIAALIGFLVTSGGFGLFGSLGTGSLSGATASAVYVSDMQITTTFLTDAGGTVAENQNVDDLLDIRLTDAQANETSDFYELDTGLLTVTRTGSLEPTSCQVRCIVPPVYEDESSPDGTTYNILERDTLGKYECYLKSGGAATTSSQKEMTSLVFADGDADQTLGVALEVDEEGHDALNQYSYRDVTIDVCGAPYTMRIHKMD
jgi:hypothetical protein